MIRPLDLLLRLGGVLPKGNPNDKRFAYGVILAKLIYLCCFLSKFSQEDLKRVDTSLTITSLTTAFLTGAVIVYKMYKYRTIYSGLTDTLLGSEQKNDKRFEILTLVIFCIMFTVRVVTRNITSDRFSFVHDVMMALTYIPTVAFILMVHHLCSMFSGLNDDMKVVANQVNSQSFPTTHLRAELNSIFVRYMSLIDLKVSLDSFFGLYNALSSFERIVYFVYTCYQFLVILRDQSDQLVLITVLKVISLLISATSVSNVCYKCSKEARETVHIALEMVQPDTPLQIMDEIEDFSFVMYKNPVQFSAAGVFTLDRKLLTKSALAAVSILIIAIQLTYMGVNHPELTAANTTDSILQATTLVI